MKGMILLIPLMLACCLAVSGCTGPAGPSLATTPAPTGTVTTATPVAPAANVTPGAAVADADNRFAFALYRSLIGQPENRNANLFFSPFSLSSAFAVVYEGAGGSTADEIRSGFSYPGKKDDLRQGFREIDALLNRPDAGYTLATANALWAEKTYAFLPDYIQTVRKYYGADATGMDFPGDPEGSRATINRWVEGQTHDRIKDLLPRGSIDSLTRLVITNAVYFKGTWDLQFDRNDTRPMDFRTLSGTTVQVPMMVRTDRDSVYGYYETGDLQVLRMPYARGNGTGLSMLVILPRGDNLSAVEGALDPAMLGDLRAGLVDERVNVWIPRFTLTTRYSLAGTLSAMGMPSVFDPASADLSGMDGTRNLSVTGVFHQAFVEVNEEGTEAAAATAVVVGMAMARPEPPVPEFRADHPFIFLIQDDGTGAILFLGRVTDPAG